MIGAPTSVIHGALSRGKGEGMSEPKTVAKTLDEVAPGLFHYSIHDERIDHLSDAYALVEKGRAVLVDPLPIEDAALARLGAIEAIVIAAPSHQRSAWRYRRQLKAKVHAPRGAAGLDEKPDFEFGGWRPAAGRVARRARSGAFAVPPRAAPGPGRGAGACRIDREGLAAVREAVGRGGTKGAGRRAGGTQRAGVCPSSRRPICRAWNCRPT
jgi:hypothetical protein